MNIKQFTIALGVAGILFGAGSLVYRLVNHKKETVVVAPVEKCITPDQWKKVIKKNSGADIAFVELSEQQTIKAMDAYIKLPPPVPSWPREEINTLVISGPSVAIGGKSFAGAFNKKGCGTQWWPLSAAQAEVMLKAGNI
jgi:hypothetical protein